MFNHYEGHGEWDFRNADTKEYTHCFHIYPAMMIPQIARKLISLYGNEGGFLFDPYCGTGTSLVEGRLAGMGVAGTDLNPTARLIALSKTIDYDIEILKTDIEKFLVGLQEEITSVKSYTDFQPPETVTYERLEDWFPTKSIAEVSFCLARTMEFTGNSRNFLLIALSECLRLVSYQRNGEFKLYRIPSDKRDEFYVALAPLLIERINRNLEGVLSFVDKVRESSFEIHDFNTVETTGKEVLSKLPTLVVTSPPYGDSGTTVAYAQFSWLTNAWLGLSNQAPGALDRSLMGGRREEVGVFGFEPMDAAISAINIHDEKRANEVMHFYNEYLKSMRNVASIIQSGGHVCYVVGNRTVKQTQLPTDQFTAWAFAQEGFEYLTTYVREIPNKRMPSRNSPTNKTGVTANTMHNEFIVVCRKE